MSIVPAAARRRLVLLTALLTASGAVHAIAPRAAGAEVVTVAAVADAKVAQAAPAANRGTATTLEVDKDPLLESFVAFHVDFPGGVVTRARLRLYVVNASANGSKVYRSATGWSETAVTWDTRPMRHELVADMGAVTAGRYIEYDVTAAVTGAGPVSFGLVADSSDGTDFSTSTTTAPTVGVIRTLAGVSAGYGGDGGPATEARFDTPHGVAVDRAGNVYVADPPNQRIRRIDASTGIVTTVAGTGSSGFSGDGGPATAAQIRYPKGVEIGPDGNLYIADNSNHRVRRVDVSTGIITTVAGSGSRGSGGDGGPATAARLDEPRNIAFDSQGRLYIVDQNNRRIRRVDLSTGIITTFASGFTFPRDVAVDRSGTVYVADEDANRIWRVSPSGSVGLFAGTGSGGLSGDGGPADLARLNRPLGVAFNAGTNTVLIADTNNDRIRAVRL